MQDVTDLPFMRVMERYGGPDLYYTEYFRVHGDSKPEKWIVQSIRECPGGKPVIAQVIGQDIPALIRTAHALEREPTLGIDLNLGCPAPIVCRKRAGGGLLRHVAQMEEIVSSLRGAITGTFTVKSRIGFDAPEEFDALLDVFSRHKIDALTVHGRTVREMYRTAVHYDRIAEAVRRIPAPVFANGNVLSVRLARETIRRTGAAGLMIGRGAIRNPWIFRQIREAWAGETPYQPTLRDLRGYIEALFIETNHEGFKENLHVAKMKKYLNFIGQGLDVSPERQASDPPSSPASERTSEPGPEAFLREIRCVETEREFFAVCDRYLDRDGTVPDEPPAGALLCPRSEALASLG